MAIERRHRIYSWLLLAVFLPVVLVSMLHCHTAVTTIGDDCGACVAHLPHATHFSPSQPTVDSYCWLCHFSALQFIKGDGGVSSVVFSLEAIVIKSATSALAVDISRRPARAPPAVA